MMVRFGPAAMTAMMQRNLSRIKENLATAQNQAMTGIAVERPSDAPTRRRQIDRLAAGVASQQTYGQNAGQIGTMLDTAEQRLGEAGNVLKRAAEIAVQMGSDIHDAAGRANAAIEVRALREQMLDIANTDLSGRHLFAGEAYDTPAFDAQGVYQGSVDAPSAQVGQDHWVEAGWNGADVFQGTTDVFAVLDNLANALETDNVGGVRTGLAEVRQGLDQVIAGRSRVGMAQKRAIDASETAQNMGEVLETGLHEAVAVDPIEAFTKFAELQTTFQAALQISGKSAGRSLFDMI